MFDQNQWYAIKFDFTVKGRRFRKDLFDYDFTIDDVHNEVSPEEGDMSQDVPALIMSYLELLGARNG